MNMSAHDENGQQTIMYDQIRGDIPYTMLYAVVMAMALMGCCYLLFRRSNAIAPDVTPPLRLRRWTAAFFAVFVLNHVWYMLPMFFLTSGKNIHLTNLIGGLLDSMTFFPLAIIVLLTMLQDRRRPLWPVWLMVMPLVVGMVWCVTNHSYALLSALLAYMLLMSIGLIIYMVRATRQYGRWLRDNYADLEHKEVWQSFLVLAIMMMVFGVYSICSKGIVYEYLLQLAVVVIICYLLWRVETLESLSPDPSPEGEGSIVEETMENKIGPLLQKYCIDTQLYLQHDLTVFQLAQAIGVNRLYLSHYFSSQGISYNTYINDLRIQHFVRLYREAVAAGHSFTAQQLANDSGYQSYSTFSLAFKQRMGQTVTAWMRNTDK